MNKLDRWTEEHRSLKAYRQRGGSEARLWCVQEVCSNGRRRTRHLLEIDGVTRQMKAREGTEAVEHFGQRSLADLLGGERDNE